MAIYTRRVTDIEAFVYQPGKGMEDGFAVSDPAREHTLLFTDFEKAKEAFKTAHFRDLGTFAEEVATRDLGVGDCGFMGYLCLFDEQVYGDEGLDLTKALSRSVTTLSRSLTVPGISGLGRPSNVSTR